jgi:GntR family transcriptional repressor for pyruvate dehydrogenase complex
MGVLEIRHGSGTYLAKGSKTILSQPQNLLVPLHGVSFAELFEARRAVEMEAAAGAALRATEENLRKLNRELELMQATLDDPAAHVKHDLAFHRNIAIASGNSVFLWFFELVSKVIKDAWLDRSRTRKLNETLAEHRTIAKAIEMRDPDGARYAMLKHLMLSKFYSDEPTEIELRVLSHAKAEETPKPRRARRVNGEENYSSKL